MICEPSTIPPAAGRSPGERTPTTASLLRHATPAARRILRALIAAQAKHKLFLPGQRVLIAASGGADSTCLLHALHQLAPLWALSLHVAHLDHALRPESADDARFVANFTQERALPFYSSRLTPGIVDDDPKGLEAAARSARYAFLRTIAEQLATESGAPVTLATAHHQDDQAETLLLHLVQGSGLTGLAGMAWVGQLPDNEQPPVRLVRPLLGVSREEIHAYLASYGLPWREDSSNDDLAHLRNRLRHQVLPLLATINPNIHATLARTADLLAAEAAHADQRDQATLAAVYLTHMPSTRMVLDLFRLAQTDLATQRGVLRHALLTLGVDLRDVGMEKLDALLAATQAARTSGPHPLIAGWAWTVTLHETSRHLSLHRADTLPFAVNHPHLSAPLASPLPLPHKGMVTCGGWQLQSNTLAPDDLPDDWRSRNHPWRFFCDADQAGELYLTSFQAGMSIAPLGMEGHQRALGDIFTDRKIAPYLRSGWPVVINGAGVVVWLCGLVVADAVRIQPATRQVRQLYWQPAAQEKTFSP